MGKTYQQKKSLAKKVRGQIESCLADNLHGIKNVAIMLSGGVDSTSILFALMALKKNITAYSFTLTECPLSTDTKTAEKTANILGVKFVRIYLPIEKNILCDDVEWMIKNLQSKKKVEVECVFPMLHSYPKIKEKYVCTGNACDGYFCLSRSGANYRDSVDGMNKFRQIYFNKPNITQGKQNYKLASFFKKKQINPYILKKKKLVELFHGSSYEDINKPRQKEIIRLMYPEMDILNLKNHQNLQLGDGHIADNFNKLLSSRLNVNKNKSVTGIYNETYRRFHGDK